MPPADGARAASAEQAPPALERLRIDRGPGARRRFPWGWLAFGIVLLLAAGGVVSSRREEWSAPSVTTGKVRRIAATEGAVETTANGVVVARRRAAISSKLSGRLDELLVDVGDEVKSGQVLGRLGHADLDAAVVQARAEIDVRKAEVGAARAEREGVVASVTAAAAKLPEMDATVREMETRLTDAERSLAMQERLTAGGASSRDAADSARTGRNVASDQLERTKRQVDTLRAEVDRARAAVAATDAKIASAQAMVAVSEAALAYAEALRKDADIVAPFSGRVVRKEAEVGEMVSPVNGAGSTTRGAVVSLADFASLEMEVDVIERDIAKVREGATSRIVLDARREHPYEGFVRQKLPTADRTKSTVQVKVAFKALDDFVLPEMGGRVEFLKDERKDAALAKDRVLAPASAFTQKDGADGVWVVSEGRVKFTPATRAGASDGAGDVEVSAGLAGGEEVVLSPPPSLTDKALVRIPAAKE